MKGWVYIEKPNTQGAVKIAHTDFEAHEISRDTGAPGSAAVEYAVLVENPRSVEAQVHKRLAGKREPNGEWFRCDVADAITALRACAPRILYEEYRSEAAREKGRKTFYKWYNSILLLFMFTIMLAHGDDLHVGHYVLLFFLSVVGYLHLKSVFVDKDR